MSATQHTPGPWKAEGNGIFGQDGIYIGAAYSPVSFGAKPLCAEALANACLIASAPDMLSALEEIASRQISVQGYNSPSALLLRLASVQSLARAAIARATGTEAEAAK